MLRVDSRALPRNGRCRSPNRLEILLASPRKRHKAFVASSGVGGGACGADGDDDVLHARADQRGDVGGGAGSIGAISSALFLSAVSSKAGPNVFKGAFWCKFCSTGSGTHIEIPLRGCLNALPF